MENEVLDFTAKEEMNLRFMRLVGILRLMLIGYLIINPLSKIDDKSLGQYMSPGEKTGAVIALMLILIFVIFQAVKGIKEIRTSYKPTKKIALSLSMIPYIFWLLTLVYNLAYTITFLKSWEYFFILILPALVIIILADQQYLKILNKKTSKPLSDP